jgi:hypothetical protein
VDRRARRKDRDGRAQGSLEYLLLLFTVILLLIIAFLILRSGIINPLSNQFSQLGGILGTSLFDVGAAIPSPTVAAPPVISNVNASPTEANATVTWDTDLPSNSSVEYGISSGSYLLTASSGTLTTGHSILLSSLSPNVTYFYRVTSCTGPPDNLCATSSESNFTTLALNLSGYFNSTDFNLSLSFLGAPSLVGADAGPGFYFGTFISNASMAAVSTSLVGTEAGPAFFFSDFTSNASMAVISSVYVGSDTGPAFFFSDFFSNSSMAPASSGLVGALSTGPGFYYINGYFNATATPAPVNVTGP